MVRTPLGHHVAQHTENLVGFAGRKYRSGFVEDQKTAPQVKLLEDLALLPLARGNRRNLGVQRNAKRHIVQELFERLAFTRPIHHRRYVVTRQNEILRHRHGRNQRKMLVDHAEAERMRRARIARSPPGAIADNDLAFVGLVVAHDAFDQRRLAGAVLTEERMEGAGPHFQRNLIERRELAEALGHVDGFDTEGGFARSRRRQSAGRDQRHRLAHGWPR